MTPAGPHLIIDLGEEEKRRVDKLIETGEGKLARKIQALQCYESQKFRGYTDERYVRALALTRGVQIDAGLAEAFEVLRWVSPL